MGKVRTDTVKRLAEALINKYSNNFSSDFEANRSFIDSLGLKMTKKMRNKVVGYVTQLKNIETRIPQEPLERASPTYGASALIN